MTIPIDEYRKWVPQICEALGGGLDEAGKVIWFGVGTPSRLERIANGEGAEVLAYAKSYQDTVFT